MEDASRLISTEASCEKRTPVTMTSARPSSRAGAGAAALSARCGPMPGDDPWPRAGTVAISIEHDPNIPGVAILPAILPAAIRVGRAIEVELLIRPARRPRFSLRCDMFDSPSTGARRWLLLCCAQIPYASAVSAVKIINFKYY